ncbi:adenylosuccinate lyase [Xanthomarina sp. GH4-25]|uniref:adenylosuccinate lyase n=1 Tax=Xanthomarina sp. GH4-25 TaxID=3349335 RepID=UPI000D67E43D|nr:adenylosuccinate lyase [Flavobacteriaceae bacterium LYZ1037]
MTKDQLYNELNYVNHSREKRLHYANLIIKNPELLPELLNILFMVDDKISCRAAWVLEFMCSEKLERLIPFLDTFTENLHKVHLDPAVRPVAKICEYITKAYFSKQENPIKQALNTKHKERIIETCFDYMINDEKIAPKAYSMNTLYLFGNEFDWIHPELILIIERDFQMQSSGFKARAKQILQKIKKKPNKKT